MIRTLAAVVGVLSLAAGCSSDGDVANTDPVPRTPTATAEPAQAPAVATDPVEFYSSGGACKGFSGPLVLWEEAKVKETVTTHDFQPLHLTGDFTVKETSVVAVPKGEVPISGSLKGERPGAKLRERIDWADREPIKDATLEPGKYYFFITADIGNRARYGGIELTWTGTSGNNGSSLWDIQDVYKPRC